MIHKEILIEELIEIYPETIRPLQEMGIQCIVCGEPVWGTLEENIHYKKLTNSEDIINRLNRIIAEKRNEIL